MSQHEPTMDSNGFPECCPLPKNHPDHLVPQVTTEQATTGHRQGGTYNAPLDESRLNAQARRVWRFMADGDWYPLAAVSAATGAPEASVSARLRDFRKPEFGGHTVERRRREGGQYEYRLLVRVLANT